MSRDTARTAILAAAITVLGRDGPDGFTAAALAREAGTSKANLFHHFESLDEIAVASFETFGTAMLDHLPDGEGVRGFVEALGDANFALVAHQAAFLRAYVVFFTRALFDPKLRAAVKRTFDPLLARLAARFEGAPDAAARARLLAIMLDGLALHLLIAGETADIRDAWRLLARFLEGGRT